jgi:DNA (cytosine-5)-methyltransferase 1
MSKLTLGSLFDGSGGFPLGGLLCGIEPLWASEIEPFPIRVTTKRIPQMKHYGDINKLNGAELPPVDIITFGSPCTDMSVAGKRAGLDGEQSVLFYEAIRIIKEMRCKTNGQYPRYAVWENVPGAFSSNKGEDFRAVLETIIGVKEPNTSVPLPEKGRWPYADIYMGDGWSVAYRTIDAQYFGVPQRRRRIYLVADFAGRSAAEILFESEGMPRNFTPSGSPWQRTSGNAKNCTGKTGTVCLNDQGGQRIDVLDGKTATLRAKANHPPCVMFENHSQDTRYKGPVDVAPTVSATYGKGGNNQPFVTTAGFCAEHSSDSRSIGYEEEISPTLRAGVVPAAVSLNETPKTLKIRSGCEGGGKGALIQDDKSATLGCNNDQTVFVPTAFGICSDKSNSMQSSNPHSGIYEADTSRTIDANGGNPGCNQGGIAVVALQGSMIGRQDKNGPQGGGINDNMSFTLNTVDRHGVVTTNPSMEMPDRLKHLYTQVMELIHEYEPDVVSIEELFFNTNSKTALLVGQARGVVILACANSGIEIREYTPLQIKQGLVGYGRADKKQVQAMVKAILNLNEVPKPDDTADALAAAICHGNSARMLQNIEKFK